MKKSSNKPSQEQAVAWLVNGVNFNIKKDAYKYAESLVGVSKAESIIIPLFQRHLLWGAMAEVKGLVQKSKTIIKK